jgi:hypothetical protein
LTRTCQKWWPYFYIFSVAYIAYVVPVQARWIQIIVTRDLAARLPRRQPSVDLGPLDVLACAAFSRHFYPTPTLPIYFGNRTWCSLPASAARGTHKNPNVKLPTRALLLGRPSRLVKS